jgi:membrane fusion protein, heavy metal efflux system
MAHVDSPLRGRIVDIKIRTGQDVKKGDELCVVESPELGEAQGDLLQKRVAKESAGPVVDLAKASWDRARGLYEQTQGTSLTEVQRREAEYKVAVAAQRAADAAVMIATNRLHLLGMNQSAINTFLNTGEVAPRYAIDAPIDGRIMQHEISHGELVSPEREVLFVLADMSSVWVLAEVPEAKRGEVAIGAKAWVRVGSSGPKVLEGQVAFITPQVNATTRTAQVRIEVAMKELPFTPGIFA